MALITRTLCASRVMTKVKPLFQKRPLSSVCSGLSTFLKQPVASPWLLKCGSKLMKIRFYLRFAVQAALLTLIECQRLVTEDEAKGRGKDVFEALGETRLTANFPKGT